MPPAHETEPPPTVALLTALQAQPEARPAVAIAPQRTWSRTFAGTPEQVPEARRFLGALLEGLPSGSDSLACLAELAANAVCHSRSSRPGGTFTVRALLSQGALRVEVSDQGGPWEPRPQSDEEHGRGLVIVSQLANAWGREGDSTTGWIVWFELELP